MTAYIYLDTGALMRHAEASATSVSDRSAKIYPHINGILNDAENVVACSEITLVEFHDVLTTYLRQGGAYDVAWWEARRVDLWQRVESGRIVVLPTP